MFPNISSLSVPEREEIKETLQLCAATYEFTVFALMGSVPGNSDGNSAIRMAIRRQFPAIRSHFRQFVGHVERRKPRNSAIRLPDSLPFKILKREMERPGAEFLEWGTTVDDGVAFSSRILPGDVFGFVARCGFPVLEFYPGDCWPGDCWG